jgi:hypothetical protein
MIENDDTHLNGLPSPAIRDEDRNLFHCESRERPKRKGKLLKKEFDALGYDFALATCYDIVARMYGYRNLNHLYEAVGLFGRSASDEEIDEADFLRRLTFQVGKLVEMGISVIDAQAIVDRVRPTGLHPSHSREARPVSATGGSSPKPG